MSRKGQQVSIYSDEMKIKIVRDIFDSKVRLNDSCLKWGISVGTYYQWKNKYIEGGHRIRRNRKRALYYLFQG